MHETIAGYLPEDVASPSWQSSTAWLDQPEHGLSTEVLANTDVLFWC